MAERKGPPRYSMLGREESVGVQARAEFSKLRDELSRTLSSDGHSTSDEATAPSPPPPPPPPQTAVPRPILASQVRTSVPGFHRVTLVFSDLGWVDLYFECCTVCPTMPGLVGSFLGHNS